VHFGINKRSATIRFTIFWSVLLLAAIAFGYAVATDRLNQQSIQRWVASGGGWAPVIYVALVAVMNATWVPRWLTTVVGGALFGILYGAALALAGSLLGCVAAYLFGIKLGHPYLSVCTNVDDHQLVAFLRRHGFLAVFLTRVCPLVPCEIVSLTSGALAIPLGGFAVASFLGMLPGSFLYAAFGSSLLDSEATAIRLGSLAGFAVLTLITAAILWRLWREETPDEVANESCRPTDS
jgi:uncharacterized membrane protein YdjX (TVP38/TMEM64 family)